MVSKRMIGAVVLAVAGAVLGSEPATPAGSFVALDPDDPGILGEYLGGCGALLLNSDEGYENAYTWQYGGQSEPDYGAFAECYVGGEVEVCAAVFDLTAVYMDSRPMDVYVWQSDSGAPGAVACVVIDADPGPVGFWPNVTRHSIGIPSCCPGEAAWWVGYWGRWPGSYATWYVAADLDGPGGCPYTKVAPGQGFPTGWSNVSIVFGPTAALGIGAEVRKCGPTPARRSTWGAVKSLYGQ